MDEPKPHVRVACALIEQDGKVLVAKRPPGKDLAGKWEFPGGKLDENESVEAALVREIEEELGCKVLSLKELTPNNHDYPNYCITLIPLVCEVVAGAPRPLEHAEIAWAAPGDLHAFDWAEADIPIVESYLASLES